MATATACVYGASVQLANTTTIISNKGLLWFTPNRLYLFIFVIAIAFVAALLSSRRATAKFLLVSRTLRSLRCVSRRLAAITRSPSAETQNITRIRLLLLEQMPRVGRLVSHCFGTIL